jgi:hypothetical protein
MRSIEPESITPNRSYGFRACAKRHIRDLPRHIGCNRRQCDVGIFLPLPHPSLRAQRSNPASLRMCHGLLRCARNDGGWRALPRWIGDDDHARVSWPFRSTAGVPHNRRAMRDPKPQSVVCEEVIERHLSNGRQAVLSRTRGPKPQLTLSAIMLRTAIETASIPLAPCISAISPCCSCRMAWAMILSRRSPRLCHSLSAIFTAPAW